MNRQAITGLLLCACIVLTGCTSANVENTLATATALAPTENMAASEETTVPEKTEDTIFSDRDRDASYSEADSISIVLTQNDISCDSNAVAISGTTVTIQTAGTYLVSGSLEDGSVIVDAEKTDKIQLVLNGVSIHSEAFAPIYVRQADKVFVTLADGTENSLSYGGSFTTEEEVNVDGVIFSRDDLTLNGSGALTITSPGGHGIVSKNSLRITGGIYTVDTSAHGLCGKDEVSIADGTFEIVAGKDGIHAENSEDAEGGSVCIEGGVYRITTEGDGISASGSCRILDGDFIITTGGGSANASQRTSNQGFRNQRGGYRPANDAGFQQNGTPPEKGMGQRGGMGGNRMNLQTDNTVTEEADTVSNKGIKAADLTMEGGTFSMDSEDDALHSDGDLTIRGGTFTIASGDDGIHADETVTVLSGSVEITESYEGMEGQHVLILGGDITLIATDDGLNAAGGMDGSGFGSRGDGFAQSGDTPSIEISGGTVSITANGDGIDANGTVVITGGTVAVSGPIQGDTSILDYDISGVISGGSFIGTGASAMAQTFNNSGQGVISVSVGTQSAGTEIVLTDSSGKLLLSHKPELDFEVVILSTPEIQIGESCKLTVGGNAGTFTAK